MYKRICLVKQLGCDALQGSPGYDRALRRPALGSDVHPEQLCAVAEEDEGGGRVPSDSVMLSYTETDF